MRKLAGLRPNQVVALIEFVGAFRFLPVYSGIPDHKKQTEKIVQFICSTPELLRIINTTFEEMGEGE